MTRTGWIVVVAVIVVVLAGYFLWSSSAAAPATNQATAANTTDTSNVPAANNMQMTGTATGASNVNASVSGQVTTGGAPMKVTVTYDGSAFSPAAVTVAQGGTVTFTDTAGQMWLASNPHPVHTGYDGTPRTEHCAAGYTGPKPLDECGSGTSFSFTFNKVGTWGYHDHMNAGTGGSVTVVAK